MAISIDWATQIISIPQADLTSLGGGVYELDVDAFRLELKDIEDSEQGQVHPDTHRHNTEVTLSGVTYARTFEIINGYTIEFEDVGSPYTVKCVGANHNIADVKVVNDVSLLIGNSAGLITVDTGGGGTTAADIWSYSTRELTGMSTAIANKVADIILRRATSNIEASANGDALSIRSLYGMIAQGVHKTSISGSTLTVTKSDDSTALATRTVTTDSNAQPIVSFDTD